MIKIFLKSGPTFIVFIILLSICFPAPVALFAQTIADVTSGAGDESVNSLGWAVTTINASGGGTITFDPAVGPVTLSQPLSVISSSVVFQGADLNLTGQDDPSSQLLFQNSFTQQNNLTLQNNGGFSAGLDASVTASAWTMASNIDTYIDGGTAGSAVTTGGVGVIGQNGGGAFVTAGFWTTGQFVQLNGGEGGSVTDTNGEGDVGGVGGTVNISGISLQTPYNMSLVGGMGGSVTDLGNGTNTGGAGGSASVSFGYITCGPYGNFEASGGQGGAGVTGGMGGGTTIVGGSVFISSNFQVQGGNGGEGVSFGGAGGNAWVSFGTLSMSSGSLNVIGGLGGSSGLSGGNGGDAFVAGGSLTFTDSTFDITGVNGVGGNNSGSLGGPANGGNGGDAGVSITSLTLASGSRFDLISGNGGNGGTGSAPGSGGQGGDTLLSIGTYSISSPTQFSSGNGGAGGNSTTGSTGGTGGMGGNLSVMTGTLILNSGSDLNLNAGNGGSGGDALSGGNGGAGGNGGSVTFTAGSVSFTGTSSGSVVELAIEGGEGGSGGSGTASGITGAQGLAFATIGTLEGFGAVSMSGNAALLQISSGDFSGYISGDETLQKTGSGTLILSGSNNYTGGTNNDGGILEVDTDGSLGTGSVMNMATLNYIDNATAGSNTITNNGTMIFNNSSTAATAWITNSQSLAFMSTSTAGSATITTNSGGSVVFFESASGGTARFILNGTGFMDISQESAGTPVTIGSLEGSGSVSLGGNNLTEGFNNLSTSFSGTIADGGALNLTGASLTKIGTGTLTLTGANTYSGGTVLDSGALAFGNSQALGLGSVSVNDGTLESAGYPVGLVIGGNYSQTSQGTLKLGLGGSQAAYYDTVSVIGNVTLGGTLNLYSYGGLSAPALGSSLVALSSSGTLTGTFQQVEESLGDIRLLPLYYNNGVELESIIPSFVAASFTSNQKAIGADLDTNVFNPQLMGMMSQLGPCRLVPFRRRKTRSHPQAFRRYSRRDSTEPLHAPPWWIRDFPN